MLCGQTIEILKAFMIAIADHELMIEKQRQYLARLEEFEPYATFIRLDRNNNGFLSPTEIYNFMKDNEFDHVTIEDCQYLVQYFDSDVDGVLNYTDFMQWVVTCDDSYLRAAVTQRDPYGVNPDEYLAPILERELAILFEKEFAYHREISIIKRDLNDAPDFTMDNAFAEIDNEGLNIIDYTSVECFLKRNGFAPTDEELTAIIRRIDVSAEASCSYNEFEEALRPVILDNYNGRSSTGEPKLANPSKVKLENLQKGLYSNMVIEENPYAHEKSPAKNIQNSNHKNYNPEEIPISKSYYEKKRLD
jgi:Ca2+-binding EF-hand superfamily protein